MKVLSQFLFLLFCCAAVADAQISPQDAAKAMTRGINIGNTMDFNPEGNGTIQERAFDDYVRAGFNAIRIPITYDARTSTTPPYTVTKAWLDRVEQVVDWGLKRQLFIVINAHHEGWLKNSYTAANKERFDSIWAQVARRLKDKSDHLIFEILNEPNPLALQNVNDLNARVLKIIRKTNPTRIVVFSGDKYTTSGELFSAAIPDVNDKYLMGYFHWYYPYPWAEQGAGSGSPFSLSDIASVKNTFDQINAWTIKYGIPVILGEWGYGSGCEYNAKMLGFATFAEMCASHGVPPFVWDDGGNFGIYNRSTGAFNENKDVIINTYPESPNTVNLIAVSDTSVRLSWKNRTTGNDSICVDRKLLSSSAFTEFAKLAPTAAQFTDSTAKKAGSYYYRLRTTTSSGTPIQSYPVMIKATGVKIPRSPFLGTPAAIPGTVQAEDFDNGGEGVAYHYASGINNEGQYRPDEGIDIGTHGAGQYQLGYIQQGEWTEYTINVTQKGTYAIIATIAAGAGAGGQFAFTFKNGTTPAYTAPATASWSAYTTISNTFVLDTGMQVMRMTVLGATAFNLDKVTFSLVTGVDGGNGVVTDFHLYNNFPNPFNPSTTIRYDLPVASRVELKLFDLLGREVAQLVNTEQKAGSYEAAWNANVSSGVYMYRIDAVSISDPQCRFNKMKMMMIVK